MKNQYILALILLLALAAGAAAAGEGTPPALPHEFYGNVTIGGAPAPAGTVITAMIGDTNCGSIQVLDAGKYGNPDRRKGNRLLAEATSDRKGATITFLVNGAAATETAAFTPGAVTRLDLSLGEVAAAPVANFSTNVTSGPAPLTVRFTDASTGAAAWLWAFGDGSTSADRNPVHTYAAPGIYTVTLAVTNAAGSDSATGVITVQDIPPAPPQAAENFTLESDAVNVTAVAGGQQVTINATAGLNVTGNEIHLQTGGLTVTIRTDNLTTAGNVSTGNVTGVHLESAPVNATVGTAGNVSVSFAAEMNGYNPTLGITASIYDQPGDAAKTAFVLAAQDENLELGNVAYAVYFTKTNLTGNNTIRDAVLRLTASPDWVNANGGVDAVRIFRLGDDGNRSVLQTTYTGMENGMMVFTAVSPEGFSAFALTAVTKSSPPAVPVANFTANVTSGDAPLTVAFTDTSINSPMTWFWDFGDTKTSTDQHPVHTYAVAGTYTVNLTVTNTAGSNSATATVTVTTPGGGEVPPALPHEFYGSVTIGGTPAPAGTVITAMIGDANCGSIQVVDAGRYGDPDRRKADRLFVEAAPDRKGATIAFLVNGAAAKETAAFTPGTVTRLDLTFDEGVTAPVAAFTANVTEGDAPLAVAFTDASTGAATWAWDFGDGGTSAEQNPVHTYVTAGTYTVNLTVTNKAGSSSATQTVTVKTPVGSISVTSAPAGAAIWLDGADTCSQTNTTLTGIPAGEHVVTLKLTGYADASMPVTVEPGRTVAVHLGLTTRTGSLTVTSVPAGAKVFIDGVDTGRVTNATIDGIGVGSHTVTLRKDGYVDAAAEIIIEEAKTATLHLNLEKVVTAPVAAFTANVTEGDAPLAVAFTDASTGAATWSWDFGDGGTSAEQNPVHTYVTAGTYAVNLTVTNKAGSSSATATITVKTPVGSITVTSVPEGATIWLDGADTGSQTNTTLTGIPAGEHVVTLKLAGYADASMPVTVEPGKTVAVHLTLTTRTGSLAVTSVPAGARVFVDGADTGRVTNTTVDGIGIGTHTVTLRKDGYVDAAAEIIIEETRTTSLHLDLEKVVTAPVAAFTANVMEGDAPLTVAFTDESTGAAAWSWDFGDGNTSAEQNPVHTYEDPGTYTVNLTVTNTAGSSSATATVTVTTPGGGEVPPALPHEFYGSVTIGGTPAPAGTVITAMIGDANCGSIQVVDAGRYGDPDRRKADRLFVEAAPDRKGATIAFLVNGAAAKETAAFTPGTVTRLDLTFDEGVTAPVAAFTANVTEGDAPLAVAFTDASTGAATRSWDFGDGGTSAEQNPVHTYVTAGTYAVNLTVTNTAGSDSTTATVTVKTPVGSIAVTSAPAGAAIWLDGADTGSLTNATLTGIPAGEHVVTLKLDGYADASAQVTVVGGETAEVHLTLTTRTGSLAVTSVPAGAKVFIDGADTGRVTNTTIDGIGVGSHTVTLRKDGYVDAAAEIIIEEAKTATLHLDLEEVVTAPVAAFTANVTEGDAPLTVAFTDESTGATAWSWDFGDGGTSAEQNPVHTYATAGIYTVNLTVTNAAGSDSATKTVTVTAAPVAPVAGFTANMASGTVPLTVRFTDASTGAAAWLWAFGDGSTSADRNPVHTYATAGIYTVTLTVTNAAGSDSATGIITVQEIPPAPPQAAENFTLESDAVNVTAVAGGQQVTINATAGLNVTGNEIHLQTGGLTVTIRTDGLNTTAGNVSTGNVTGVHLESAPVNATVGTAGNVSVSFEAEMNGYNPALGITTAIYDQPGDAAKTAFVLAAQDENLELGNVAYAVYFTKTNLTGNDTIRDAVLRLTASPDWVNANGGIDAVRIFRLGDDGNRSVLQTTYTGMENGMMVFTAVSPEGFSAFALAAVAGPAPAPASSGSSGGGSSTAVGAASNLRSGESATLTMRMTAISAVTLTAKNEVKEAMVTVAEASLPRAVEPPAGTVYQYVKTTLYRAAPDNFSGVQLRFAVPTAWLRGHGCTAEKVALFLYTGDGWQTVPVEALGDEDGNAVFSAAPDGFGLFSIAATGEAPGDATPGPTRTTTTPAANVTTPPATPPVEEPPAEGLPMKMIAFIAGAVVIIAAAGYLLMKRR